MTSDYLIISILVLLLVLMVLLVLCWILKHSRNMNLTELQISAGQPTRVLTIRIEPDRAQEMLDHLLDRVFLQAETQSGEELEEELVAEPGEYLSEGSGSESNSEVSTAGCLPRRATPLDRLWKWVTAVVPPAATPPPRPPSDFSPYHPSPNCSVSQDETDFFDIALSSMGPPTVHGGEEETDELQVE